MTCGVLCASLGLIPIARERRIAFWQTFASSVGFTLMLAVRSFSFGMTICQFGYGSLGSFAFGSKPCFVAMMNLPFVATTTPFFLSWYGFVSALRVGSVATKSPTIFAAFFGFGFIGLSGRGIGFVGSRRLSISASTASISLSNSAASAS